MWVWMFWFLMLWASACSRSAEISLKNAPEHARELVAISTRDVAEVRRGLPEGAKHLAELFSAERAVTDLQQVRRALERARSKVQDLRVAKSTFFAVVDDAGNVIRTDQEQDLMAGKKLFVPFPELRKALLGAHVETAGAMPEAAGVSGRMDGQWVCAEPVRVKSEIRALYVTGWSWSAYAYRLETALRSSLRSSVGEHGKLPLVYVYLIVGGAVFGAPISPEVNAEAIRHQAPLSKLAPDGIFSNKLEITGRDFGLGVVRAPALGNQVGIAVLRSET